MHQPIYRDYEFTLSKNMCATFLQALAITKGCITSTSVLTGSYPAHTVNRWSMLCRLRFSNQENLDAFHAMGFETTDPPKFCLDPIYQHDEE